MRDGWEIKKLGDICSKLTDGSHNPPKGIEHSDYVMLSSQNVFNDNIVLNEVRYLQEDDFLQEDRRTSVREGDVLLTIVGTVGRCAVFTGNMNVTLQRSVAVLRPQECMVPRYLMHCLIAKNASLNENAHGIAQKGIYLRQLSQVMLPVPPLPEQERIVAELDCLSSIIEKQKQQLKEYDTLAQSIFYDMFGDPITNEKGWEMVVFESACSSITKGPFGSDIKKSLYVERSDDAYKVYIQANAIEKDLTVGTYYISKEYFDEKMFRFEVHPYDYIITCDGTLGKFIRLPETVEKGIISASLLRLSIREEILSPKYFEFIWDEYMLPLLVKDVRNTALKHLPSAGKIGKVCIPLPDIKIQREFASKIEAIEKQKAILKKSIEEAETLFNSRMDYYFN